MWNKRNGKTGLRRDEVDREHEHHYEGQTHPNEPEIKLKSDEEILNALPEEFYRQELDVIDLIFKQLSGSTIPDESYLEHELMEKERALDIITSKLSKNVMDNYDKFVQGMTQIHDLGMNLQTAGIVCKNSRGCLKTAKQDLTQRVLMILDKNRKKNIYHVSNLLASLTKQQILDNMYQIKRIAAADVLLKKTLADGDFPAAIKLCLDCRTAMNACKQFLCVSDLGQSLQESYNLIQEKVDQSLMETCRAFNPKSYERVLIAYRILGQSHRVMDKIQSNFLESIVSNFKNVVFAHILMQESNERNIEQLKKLKFRDLCAAVAEENFVGCLVTVLEVLTDLMYVQYQANQWHTVKQQQIKRNLDTKLDDDTTPPPELPEDEAVAYFQEVQDGLEKFKKTLWSEMQSKVSVILSAPALTKLKIDDFLKVLDAVYKFIDIGEEFSGSEANNLKNSIKTISKSYFDEHHKKRMEDLCTMLDNEMWQRCPVHKNFGIKDLKEFKMFRVMPTSWEQTVAKSEHKAKVSVFAVFKTYGNPFSKNYKQNRTEEEMDNNEDDDVSSELSVSSVESDGRSPPSSPQQNAAEGPIITTTTIKVCRYLGQYAQMTKILQPIAFEVFVGISEMFQFYIYTVYTFFAEEEEPLSIKLRAALARWKKQYGTSPMLSAFVVPGRENNNSQLEADALLSKKIVTVPKLQWPIHDPADLMGFSKRIVGIESMLFVQHIVEDLKPHLQYLLPKSRDRNLTEFYSDVEAVPELVKYTLRKFVSKITNWEDFASMIANTKWDLKDLGIEHSPYVNHILKELNMFSKKLTKETKVAGIPNRIVDMIWEEVIKYTMDYLVEGYSRPKKCSNQGRALMNLDLQNIQTGLSQLTRVKMQQYVHFVDNFIKAYYLPEDMVLNWCKEHTEYSLKQWMSIVNLGSCSTLQKKQRQDLVTALEELDRQKKSTLK